MKIKENIYCDLTDGQREYVQLSFIKFQKLQAKVYSKRFFNLRPIERFNTCREIYTLFNELNNLTPAINESLEGGYAEIADLIKLTKFIRDVLSHYILSDFAWNKVYITPKLAKELSKQQSIYKYLMEDKKDFEFKLADNEGNEIIATVKLGHPKGYNDKIYLKDIIGEQAGILVTVSLIKIILYQFIERDGTAKIFKEGEQMDGSLKAYFSR